MFFYEKDKKLNINFTQDNLSKDYVYKWNKTRQTVRRFIYDMSNKKLYVKVQEQDTEH